MKGVLEFKMVSVTSVKRPALTLSGPTVFIALAKGSIIPLACDRRSLLMGISHREPSIPGMAKTGPQE